MFEVQCLSCHVDVVELPQMPEGDLRSARAVHARWMSCYCC